MITTLFYFIYEAIELCSVFNKLNKFILVLKICKAKEKKEQKKKE